MDDKKKELLRANGFSAEVERVESGKCPFCGQPVDHSAFRDELSRKEFALSGLCMSCQDSTFGNGEDEPDDGVEHGDGVAQSADDQS